MPASPVKPMTDVARFRFVSNVASNACYVVLNTALMLWYIPFLVSHLGVAAYGMIALANSLVMYGALVGTSLNVSITRFLAIDLNQGNDASANRTFNTALALSIIACSALSVPVGILTYFLPALFNVPVGLEPATQFLFASVCAAFIVTILSSNFGVASVIMHRFDLRNIVQSVTLLTRVGIIALCFMVWPATLWQVAAAFVISAMIGLAGDVVVWRRLTPELHLNYRDIDRHHFRALVNLGGWSAVNQTGALLLMQVDLLIVNAMFGAEMTGRYGAVVAVPCYDTHAHGGRRHGVKSGNNGALRRRRHRGNAADRFVIPSSSLRLHWPCRLVCCAALPGLCCICGWVPSLLNWTCC